MKNNLTILSTKILKPYIKDQLVENDFNVVEHDFIKIEIVGAPLAKQIVTTHLPNYIFTSKNAVKAFIRFTTTNKIVINKKANFFALSGETQLSLEDEGYKVLISKDNATALANEIISTTKEKQFVFFCGDKRRSELPNALQHAGLRLTEIVLYKNLPRPKKIVEQYQAILFFSPSGVKSFFEENVLPKFTQCFCIGYTTANALKEYKLNNKIAVISYPSQQVMIDEVLHYFNIKN
ncbi:MAG: uroporphyrinogen-III synthase [Ferruginibacter sp.]